MARVHSAVLPMLIASPHFWHQFLTAWAARLGSTVIIRTKISAHRWFSNAVTPRTSVARRLHVMVAHRPLLAMRRTTVIGWWAQPPKPEESRGPDFPRWNVELCTFAKNRPSLQSNILFRESLVRKCGFKVTNVFLLCDFSYCVTNPLSQYQVTLTHLTQSQRYFFRVDECR